MSKAIRGRKVSQEYFKEFDSLKNVGEKLTIEVNPERFDTKYIQMRVLNQSRSYRKFYKVDFKISTRISQNNILIFLMNR